MEGPAADRMSPEGVRGYMEARRVEVERFMEDRLSRGNHGKVLEAIRYYPMAGGKRLRPVLALAAADAVSPGSSARAMPFAVSLELVHNFTLVHDDIMDEDTVRRGLATLHTVWDEATAINAGDILFALAFETVAMTEADDATVRTLVMETARTVFEIGEGQQWDMDFEGARPGEVSEEEYLRMIEFKTARLFEQAARGGARVAGADESLAVELGLYAREMGLAFQIWDDYLDIYADQERLGKDVGSDIRNGKHTIMAIHALANASGEDLEAFTAAFGNPDAGAEELGRAIGGMERAGSIEHARAVAVDYAARAEARLSRLEPSEHREFLRGLIHLMITRDH